jgi:ribonuclease R
MPFQSKIVAALSAPSYRPANAEALVRQLKIEGKQRRRFAHEVRLMLSRGELTQINGDQLILPRDVPAPRGETPPPVTAGLVGRIQFRAGGSAFVLLAAKLHPKSKKPLPAEAVQVAPEDTGVAFHGDTVRVRLHDGPARGGRRPPRGRENEPRGHVVAVVERGRAEVVGTLRRVRNRWIVTPDDPRFVHEFAVGEPPTKGRAAAEPGDKVVVHLDEWTDVNQPPAGTIIERLGKTYEPRAELLGVYRKFNLDPRFPRTVEQEARGLPTEVTLHDLGHRLDYRDIPTFTIDPDDAKDFDDALSVETLDDGSVKVGVHIADVSAYVKPSSPLDAEARRRGNSTYLVGTVVPMLPEKLSNGLCSLVEGQDRLTKAVFLTFDLKGRLRDQAFANTIIRSRKRLTYKQAYALLHENDLAAVRRLPLPPKHQTGSTGRALASLTDLELLDLQTWVRKLWTLASRLRQDRMAHGSLDLDMPETKVLVDEQGYAERLEKVEHDESHQLIEEFMLAANEAVARLTKTHRLPALYRVHDDPDEEKLGELRQQLAAAGVKVGDLTHRPEMTRALAALRDHPQGHVLRTQLLRSLKKAAYRSSPDGHYGLHKRDYAHFTSPIRRYADLVVHRVFDHALIKHGGWPTPPGYQFAYNAAKVAGLGEHLSLTETNSQEAERESVKIKTLEFFERELARKPKTRFVAIITDVRPNGLFIELAESMTFGFIPAGTLPGDSYHLDRDGGALVGQRRKRRFALSGQLEVVVAKVDRAKRIIDFHAAA